MTNKVKRMFNIQIDFLHVLKEMVLNKEISSVSSGVNEAIEVYLKAKKKIRYEKLTEEAVLSINWKTRVKGRDFYDYVYFLSMETSVNMKHLKSRLIQSKCIDTDFELTKESLINLLYQRFDEIDFEEIKKDVEPFISNLSKLDLWSNVFFKEITKNILVS